VITILGGLSVLMPIILRIFDLDYMHVLNISFVDPCKNYILLINGIQVAPLKNAHVLRLK